MSLVMTAFSGEQGVLPNLIAVLLLFWMLRLRLHYCLISVISQVMLMLFLVVMVFLV